MKIFTFAFFMTLIAIGYSWESSGFSKPDPAHPGKCVIAGLILSPGEEGKLEGQCVSIRCGSNGHTTTQGCGTAAIDPPCKIGNAKYPNEPYPKCCEMEIICPEGIQPTNISATV